MSKKQIRNSGSSARSVSRLLQRSGFEGFDLHLGDAVAFHLFDGVAASLIIERVADNRNFLQARQHESRKCFKSCVAGQHELILRLEIANVDSAFEQQSRVFLDRWLSYWRNVKFVFDLADQLLENIFDSDHACGRSEFIDNYCQMTLALLELRKQVGERHRFGNNKHVAHDLADLHFRNARTDRLIGIEREAQAHPAGEVLGVQHADNVFTAALRIVDWNARMLLFNEAGQRLVECEVGG